MRELGIDLATLREWLPAVNRTTHLQISVQPMHADVWKTDLGAVIRRCYISDAELEKRANESGFSKAEIVASKLPDRGAVMSGDFGEIVAFFLHAERIGELPSIGPKKWRLKEDRRRAAPYSDVVHFVLPNWPIASPDDLILCSEVKASATGASENRVGAAIEGCRKDRVSRLGKTLVWLRDRAVGADIGGLTVPHLDRFIDGVANPPFKKQFQAVVVVCSSVLAAELAKVPAPALTHSLYIIEVPDLQTVYEAAFDAAHASAKNP